MVSVLNQFPFSKRSVIMNLYFRTNWCIFSICYTHYSPDFSSTYIGFEWFLIWSNDGRSCFQVHEQFRSWVNRGKQLNLRYRWIFGLRDGFREGFELLDSKAALVLSLQSLQAVTVNWYRHNTLFVLDVIVSLDFLPVYSTFYHNCIWPLSYLPNFQFLTCMKLILRWHFKSGWGRSKF